MIIVIPMAGKGDRFFKAGYKIPKYMIQAKDKTLFEYSLSSLPLDIAKKIIFVGLSEHNEKYNLTEFINKKIKILSKNINYEIVLINEITGGQAETVLKAKDFLNQDEDLMIYNIDTYFYSKNLKEKLLDKTKKKDGIIGAFKIDFPDNKWSYARINSAEKVIETTEKIPISNYALTGLYHFTRAKDFLNIAESHIASNKKELNEFYVAPMYNDLIKRGKEFVLDVAEDFIPLGVPQDVEVFLNDKK
ncbi:MAG: sugar phosphate nucleotidyltransferase [bacterium]